MTLEEIVATLQEEEFLTDAEVPLSARPPAWYIRVLAGLGAWLATLFLVFFWAIIASQNYAFGVFLGLAQCLLAGLMATRLRRELLSQVALSLWLTGACLLTFTSEQEFHGNLFGSGSLLLLLAACYPESQGRFLAALAGGILVVSSTLEGFTPFPLDIVVGPLALLAGVHYLNQTRLWWSGWGRRTSSFAGVAVLTMLYTLCLSFWGWSEAPAGVASTLLLTMASLWLSTRVLSRLKANFQRSIAVWLGLLGLGLVTLYSPGVMGGIAVLLLACESRSRWLTVIGWLYLLIFSSAYMVSLEMSLNGKAASLMAVGALLLGLRRALLGKS